MDDYTFMDLSDVNMMGFVVMCVITHMCVYVCNKAIQWLKKKAEYQMRTWYAIAHFAHYTFF